MKSKTRRRVIALVLCMVMLLSCGVTTLAEGNTAEPAVTGETAAQENVSAETQTDTAADDTAVVSESQEKMAAAETAETETEETASSDVAVQSETADTEGIESAQTEESTAADTTEQTAGTESGDAAVQSEEETTAGNDAAENVENNRQQSVLSFEGEVEGIKVIVSADDTSVLPSNAILSVTKIDEKSALDKFESAIAEDVAANNTTIQDMLVLDIKFLVDGEEVQPNGKVRVDVENTGYSQENGISVYHVSDDFETTTDMGATVDSVADVTFETTHFSDYVIVNNGDDTVHVTIEHYLNKGDGTDPIKLYRNYEEDLQSGDDAERISNFTKEDEDYALEKVVKIENGQEISINDNEILVNSDVTYRCYYVPQARTYVNGTTFFDYEDGSANDYNSINWRGNYPSGSAWENRLGTIGAADDYRLMVRQNVVVNGEEETATFNANAYFRVSQDNIGGGNGATSPNYTRDNTYKYSDYQFSWPIITGLIKEQDGLTGDNYENVNFNYAEPGFFSAASKRGKRIYEDYFLNFNKVGNRYTLSSVGETQGNGNTTTVLEDLNNFFPLNNKNNGNKNEFFGMRYDFTFKVGDYLGDMTYSFTGDDDLWVFLDGDLILDLGGIHGAYQDEDKDEYNDLTNSLWQTEVDVWECLTGEENPSESDKLEVDPDTVHTVTVLYMERGGEASNCHMEFVMPNVTASDPVISTTPKADLEFEKLDLKDNSPVEGAVFGLYSTESCPVGEEIDTASSDSSGNVIFENLKEGIYYLKETKTPAGYLPNSDVYRVVVEVKDDNATATIYDKNNNKLTNKIIYNQMIENSIESSKTAHVKDWDNRTYDITLNASSIAQATTSAEPVDIVLAFDTSSSMLFPSSLKYYAEGTTEEAELEKEQIYYWIDDPTKQATVMKVWYDFEEKSWYSLDASKNINDPDADEKTEELGKDEKHTFYICDDLDSSGNPMTRLYYLQQAAIQFVNDIADASSDSRVSLITFNKSAYTEVELGSSIGENKDDLVAEINGIQTASKTNQKAALTQAKQQLDNTKAEGRKQYVILLTDGAPNGCTEESIRTAASDITNDSNRTLITVGVNLDQIKSTIELMEKIATKVDGKPLAFNAASGDELSSVLGSIFQTIIENVSITQAVIKDYIDPRFVVDESSVNAVGGTVSQDDKGTYVIWTNQEILVQSATGNPGWSKTFTVKAKDNYIGGNAVTTNGEGSGITVENTTIPFVNPEVNVKINLEVGNYETTIFKGDSVGENTKAVIDNLFDVGAVISKYNNEKDPLTEEELQLKWYSDEECTQEVQMDELNEALTEPDSNIQYYLQVIYTGAGNSTDQSRTNTDDHIAGEYVEDTNQTIVTAVNQDKENYPNAEYGVYKVTVISGNIVITKEVPDNVTEVEGTQTFEFIITGPNGYSETVSIQITPGEKTGKLSQDALQKLSNLARGEYTITEVATEGYAIKEINTNDSNCKVEKINNSIKFTLGTFVENEEEKDTIISEEYEKGILGEVKFTNEKVIKNWAIKKLSSSDTNPPVDGVVFKLSSDEHTYFGKSESDGIVVWYNTDPRDPDFDPQTAKVEKLVGGDYILEELETKTGYVLSNEKWTVQISESGYLKAIIDDEDQPVNGKQEVGSEILYFYFYNDIRYDLPSAGGSGIYWYMLSGVLLMMAGSLLVYKKRCGEVLRRK